MDEHHDGADGAARLEHQDPAAVEEEEDGEAELDGVAKGADVVDPVVQRLPQAVLPSHRKLRKFVQNARGNVGMGLGSTVGR